MALWGNLDRKEESGTIAIATNGAVTGSSTAFTTEAKIGNTIRADGRDYVITTITSDTACTVESGINGGAITAVTSGTSYTLSEKPVFVSQSECADSGIGNSGNALKVFGVDTGDNNGENYDSAGRVVEVGVATGGSGYVEAPGVTISGGGGSDAEASATISGGVVTSITVTDNGGSYENVPTVTVQAPCLTIPTTAVNTTTEVITYTGHTLTTGAAIVYDDGGSTAITGLTDGTTYYAIRVDADSFKVASSASNATAGTAINLTGTGNDGQAFFISAGVRATAVAALGGGNETGESRSNIAHTGWVRRTTGTGGRAGRVHYETLVAMGSIDGDQADDRQFTDD
jgi:hypothetical protein